MVKYYGQIAQSAGGTVVIEHKFFFLTLVISSVLYMRTSDYNILSTFV